MKLPHSLPWLATLLTLSLYGAGLLALFLSGKLGVYIHPTSSWFIAITGAIFLILPFALRPGDLRERASLIGLLCLFCIALLVIFVRPTALSVETAKARLSPNAAPAKADPREITRRNTSDFSIADWLAILSDLTAARRYDQRPVDLSGFLLFQDGRPYVARLIITCCGADAQPALLPFTWPGELPPENTWIHLSGTMHTASEEPYIEAKTLKTIPEPQNPYAQ